MRLDPRPLVLQVEQEFAFETMAQHLSIGGDAGGGRALQYLIDPKRPSEDDPELLINAASMTGADAFTGAVLRGDVEQHLRKGRRQRVSIWPPTETPVWRRLHDLLGPLPTHCSYPDDHQAPERDPRILLPAAPVSDMEDAGLLALALRLVSQVAPLGRDRLNPRQAGFLATVLPALVDNGLRHAPDSECGVVVCAALGQEGREAQLVALDLGSKVSGARNSLARLRASLDRRRQHYGGLISALDLASKRGLKATALIRSGDAVARFRDGWHTGQAAFSPGWCVGITVQR